MARPVFTISPHTNSIPSNTIPSNTNQPAIDIKGIQQKSDASDASGHTIVETGFDPATGRQILKVCGDGLCYFRCALILKYRCKQFASNIDWPINDLNLVVQEEFSDALNNAINIAMQHKPSLMVRLRMDDNTIKDKLMECVPKLYHGLGIAFHFSPDCTNEDINEFDLFSDSIFYILTDQIGGKEHMRLAGLHYDVLLNDAGEIPSINNTNQ